MDTLFELPETPSPRLVWMRKLGVVTEQSPKNKVGDEDEEGNFIHAWYAYFKADEMTAMGGATEQEALCNFAKFHNLKLWNEL